MIETFAAAAPAYVQVFPTLRCDRSCGFCFNRGLPDAGDLAPAAFERMLDRLHAAGVKAIDLLGGEPTLHPRLGELVAAVAARDMRARLSTNGRGRFEVLERIEDTVGRDRLRVGVSINGGQVPATLASYIRRRAPMLKSVCTRGWRLPSVAAEHLGSGGEFYLLYEDAVRPADLERTRSFPAYLRRLRTLQRKHPGVRGVWCTGFISDPGDGPALTGVRCPAGTTKISVLPDGSTYPCYLLFSRPEFRLGSLADDPLENIWRHPALDFFRNFNGNPCAAASCTHHGSCRGGCPAVALLAAGDLRGADPRCAPRRSEISNLKSQISKLTRARV